MGHQEPLPSCDIICLESGPQWQAVTEKIRVPNQKQHGAGMQVIMIIAHILLTHLLTTIYSYFQPHYATVLHEGSFIAGI